MEVVAAEKPPRELCLAALTLIFTPLLGLSQIQAQKPARDRLVHEPPSASQLRTKLYRSLADSQTAPALRAAQALERLSLERPERVALDRLRRALDTRLHNALLESLAGLRAACKLRKLAAALEELPARSVLTLWLRLELCLAVDHDGITARDRSEALQLARQWLAHPGNSGTDLDPWLARLLRRSAEARAILAASDAVRAMPSRIRRQRPPSLAQLRTRVQGWILLLETKRLPSSPTLVDSHAWRVGLRRLQREHALCTAYIKKIGARIRRLKAQIPRMTDPERRDAISNRGRIAFDMRRLEREREQAKKRLGSSSQALRRWKTLWHGGGS